MRGQESGVRSGPHLTPDPFKNVFFVLNQNDLCKIYVSLI